MARRNNPSTETTDQPNADAKAGTEPAAEQSRADAPPAEPAEQEPVRLISRYAELGVRDLVRFHNGRATVSRETFDQLTANPAFGFGVDFWVDPTTTPAANAA